MTTERIAEMKRLKKWSKKEIYDTPSNKSHDHESYKGGYYDGALCASKYSIDIIEDLQREISKKDGRILGLRNNSKELAEESHYDIKGLCDKVTKMEKELADYKEVLEDKKCLVRMADVAINGVNAAKQASMCDIVSQLEKMARDNKKCVYDALEENKLLKEKMKEAIQEIIDECDSADGIFHIKRISNGILNQLNN